MNIIEIRIGKNVNGAPMVDDRWASFVDQARAVLDGIAAGLAQGRLTPLSSRTEVHRGIGTWTDADGVEQFESSAVVSLYLDAPLFEFSTARDTLMEFAAELAAEFEQDAVAVVWQGESTLVSA